MGTKTLVMGWFSFERADATAGDLIAKDVVCEWLEAAGRDHEVALAPPFEGGIDASSVAGGEYRHVVFVCGPFFKNNLLRRFEPSKLVGVNLSMVAPVEEWNPFDLLLERDSSEASRPDITFLAAAAEPTGANREGGPAIGIVMMEPGDEPADRVHHEQANAKIRSLLDHRQLSVVPIDTRLDVPNRSGLRSPREIEDLIAGMDLIVTTRLHGLVFAIRNLVPAVAIDPIPSGGKLTRQANSIGWPLIFPSGAPMIDLEQAMDQGLGEQATVQAAHSRETAVEGLREVRRSFIEAMRRSLTADWGDGRRTGTWIEGDRKLPRSGRAAGQLRRAARRISNLVRRPQS